MLWRHPLSHAVERLERELAQLGFVLQPTRPLPEVIRQPTTCRLVVIEHPSLGAAAALERLAASLRSEGRPGGPGAGGLAENALALVVPRRGRGNCKVSLSLGEGEGRGEGSVCSRIVRA